MESLAGRLCCCAVSMCMFQAYGFRLIDMNSPLNFPILDSKGWWLEVLLNVMDLNARVETGKFAAGRRPHQVMVVNHQVGGTMRRRKWRWRNTERKKSIHKQAVMRCERSRGQVGRSFAKRGFWDRQLRNLRLVPSAQDSLLPSFS